MPPLAALLDAYATSILSQTHESDIVEQQDFHAILASQLRSVEEQTKGALQSLATLPRTEQNESATIELLQRLQQQVTAAAQQLPT
eukprot:m.149460 g.149460  ORF g.149460 m.149460 type:complete len:86 (-) comp52772_c0_seq1:118-375(-)